MSTIEDIDPPLCGKCNSPAPVIDIICDKCGHLTLLDGVTFRRARRGLVIQIAILLAAIFFSFVLFRYSLQIWPLYLIFTLGTVGLFAVVLTRAAALTVMVASIAASVIMWGLWILGLGQYLDSSTNSTSWRELLPPILVCMGTGGAFITGKVSASPGLRDSSAWFLAIATFVLGAWGSWGVFVQDGYPQEQYYDLVLVLAVLLPLAALAAILIRERPLDSSRANSAAVWLLVIAAYLSVVEYIAAAGEFLFGGFLPAILGQNALALGREPMWLLILDWKSTATIVIGVIATLFIGASSVTDTIGSFRAQRRTIVSARIAKLQGGNISRADMTTASQLLTIRIAVELNILASFVTQTAKNFVTNLWKLIKRSTLILLKLMRYLAPIIAFSSLALLTILVLEDLASYAANDPAKPSSIAVWGEVVTVMIFSVLLSALSLSLTPGRPFSVQRSLFAGAKAATLLLFGTIYFPFSIIASISILPLWFTLRSHGIRLDLIAPGPAFYVNLSASVGIILVVTILQAVLGPSSSGEGPSSNNRREWYLFYSVAAAGGLFAIVGIFLSILPISDRVIRAAESSSIEQFLHSHDTGPILANYAGHIAQGNGDAKTPKTSWYVTPDLKRLWIPDGGAFDCLKSQGALGPDILSSDALNSLPDQVGRWAACGDTLSPNRVLRQNMYLRSRDGRYILRLQLDGNLVLYGPTGRALWSDGRTNGQFVVMQTDGNVVSYTDASAVTWSSNTTGKDANRLVVQNDGNLVIYSPSGAVWASDTGGQT